jgi:hypothetical protein
MNLLGALWTGAKMVMGFGSGGGKGSDNVMTIAKGVGGFIDEQNFTTEEQAIHKVKLIGHMETFMENSVNENSERSKARREIALLVMRWTLFMLTLSAVLYKPYPDLAQYIKDIVTQDPMGYFILGIAAFFFGAHIVRSMKK